MATIRASLFAASVLLASLTFPAVLQAQESAANMAMEDAYDALYETIFGQMDVELTIDNQLETLKSAMATQDPNLAALNRLYPEFLDEFGAAMRPAMIEHSRYVQGLYRPRYIEMYREMLSVEEAEVMAAFYSSPTGRALIAGVGRNYTGSNVLGDIGDLEGGIEANDVERDVKKAATLAVTELEVDSSDPAVRAFMTDPVLTAKVEQIGQRTLILRTEMENAPMAPEQEQRMIGEIEALMKRYEERIQQDYGN